jgi:hypothetical protein
MYCTSISTQMRFIRIMVILLILHPQFLCAEESGNTRTCRIFFLERPPTAPAEAYLFDGTESHQVSLPSRNFSGVVKLPTGKLTLSLTPNEIVLPEELPEAAPSIVIPEKDTDLYLILTSDPANTVLPIKLQSVSLNQKIEAGETLWVNLSNHIIIATLEKESVTIPPKKIIISQPPLDKSGYYTAKFEYRKGTAGKLLPIMTKYWWLDRSSRNLGFIIGNQNRLPKIFTIRDRRDPEMTAIETE